MPGGTPPKRNRQKGKGGAKNKGRRVPLLWERSLREFFLLFPHPLLLCTAEGKILKRNPPARSFLSPRKESHLSQLFPTLPLPLRRDLPGPWELIQGDKDRVWIRVFAFPVNFLREQNFLLLLEDITELKTLHLQKKELIANVSHELKTPVTTISGYAEMLAEGEVHSLEEAREFAAIILRNARRLMAILHDLIQLSWMEAAEEKGIERVPVSLPQLIEEVLEDLKIQMERQGVTVHSELPGELRFPLNPTMFHHALLNLVDNAIKYTPRGKKVWIRAHRKGSELLVEVEDQGPGIPREHLPRIFERFYRVDPSRSRALGGTGLGLAIVKHAVLAHRGTIEVESKVGSGTKMVIRIPQG